MVMAGDDGLVSHVEDTFEAGRGLCNEAAVETMIAESVQQVSELTRCAPPLDKQDSILPNLLKKQERVRVVEHAFIVDLMTHEGKCYGGIAFINNTLHCIFAKATILASGGLGHIYQCTSNPAVATGDGFAAAWRAGCQMMDMEFIQFHPTTLFLMDLSYCLVSGRVREEGGILINARGERFMAKYHKLEELAPCDVISHAIVNEMELTGAPCVYLDLTDLQPNLIQNRFSRIYQLCYQFGIDITSDVIPVRAGAHFMIGGVSTNLNAETSLRGLFACGEVACTSVHGADCIAGNTFFECVVFGARAGRAAIRYVKTVESNSHKHIRICSDDGPPHKTPHGVGIEAAKEFIQQMMWQRAGVVRHAEDLEATHSQLRELTPNGNWYSVETFEFQNMCDVAALIVEAALLRAESRGMHYRADFPKQNDAKWKKHIILQRGRKPKLML